MKSLGAVYEVVSAMCLDGVQKRPVRGKLAREFAQPAIGVAWVFAVGGLLIGFLYAEAGDQRHQKRLQMRGGIAKRRDVFGEIEPEGGATTEPPMPVRAIEPLAYL